MCTFKIKHFFALRLFCNFVFFFDGKGGLQNTFFFPLSRPILSGSCGALYFFFALPTSPASNPRGASPSPYSGEQFAAVFFIVFVVS